MSIEKKESPSVFDSIRNIKSLYESTKEEIENPFEELFSDIWNNTSERSEDNPSQWESMNSKTKKGVPND